jgi:hypothetical protein
MPDTPLSMNEATKSLIVTAEPKTPPPTPTLHRRVDWPVLVGRLLSNPVMTWFRIPLSSLPGETTKLKQSNLISALSSRDIKVQTTTEHDFIYVRSIDPHKHF